PCSHCSGDFVFLLGCSRWLRCTISSHPRRCYHLHKQPPRGRCPQLPARTLATDERRSRSCLVRSSVFSLRVRSRCCWRPATRTPQQPIGTTTAATSTTSPTPTPPA